MNWKMLKIKDNVDLKELEKFGFEKVYDPILHKYDYMKKVYLCNDNDDRVVWGVEYRTIKIFRLDGEDIDSTLFDLIQEGLVEKVSD